jgi:hypothetical protein
MAARGQTLAERFARWQVLVGNLKEEDGLPHVAEEQQRLEALLTEARALENRKDEMRSEVRTINARLRALSRQGDELRSRVGFNLKGKFGVTSETLIRFGFEPKRIPRRRSKVEIAAEKAKEEAEKAAAAAKAAVETKAPAGVATPTGVEG